MQGAELDVFKGGFESLSSCLLIVSEVEFVELYKNQPLFGGVSKYLGACGFMFHKFENFGGRTLKPVVLNNNINTPSQWLWADAIFVKHVNSIDILDSFQLLKMAILSLLYDSIDLTYFCLKMFDNRNHTNLSAQFLSWYTQE